MAGNQPLSFKTVPGRNRTQKWTQAKTYNYDGDEWGGYDPYDEYGDYDEQAASASQTQPARPQRQNSFDAGDERRNFSAGYVEHSRGPTAAGHALQPCAFDWKRCIGPTGLSTSEEQYKQQRS
ncbi:hypothetical protein KC355_g21348 [Hortaea werneckii]|nr:hypothetical protein KC355_g21348 [Hortaea werneckii]